MPMNRHEIIRNLVEIENKKTKKKSKTLDERIMEFFEWKWLN